MNLLNISEINNPFSNILDITHNYSLAKFQSLSVQIGPSSICQNVQQHFNFQIQTFLNQELLAQKLAHNLISIPESITSR